MGTSALLLSFVVAIGSAGAPISTVEIEKQEQVFRQWWNDDFEWRFDALPTKGGVPKQRIPYSGHIYLDKNGGTAKVMRKWDEAVNEDYSYPATAWEQADTSEARSGVYRGFFGRRYSGGDNEWYGHCNGWSAAAIRHAEPEQRVRAYGTEFTPADIKGLLAEVYMYNEIEMLAGYETELNAGVFHAILANWLGRGSHPVAMDSDPGKEKWNYPIYSYASSHGKHSSREIEVRTNIAFSKDTDDAEYHRSPAIRKFKSFHYMLQLRRGKIVGGYYFPDSAKIDFVWVPLRPKSSGDEGNEAGNPHLSVAKVLAIWRKSVPLEKRRRWLVIDPPAKDRSVEVDDPTRLLPRNIRIVPPARTAENRSDEVAR